jgi:transposase InsO family protein
VRTWYSEPYTPQHNGKTERLWQTLETTTGPSHDETIIANLIHHDNFVWKHSSLGITPQAARHGIRRWGQLAPGELDPDIWKNLGWIQ